MAEELVMQVKWPIADLEDMARRKYSLKQRLTDFRIEGDNLVLYFSAEQPPASVKAADASGRNAVSRRKRGRRNRIKTRGWALVAKFKNSKGQTCSIYKPLVDALQDQSLSQKEQRTKVREVLKSNGNSPSDDSVEYFLSNTLEFLKR